MLNDTSCNLAKECKRLWDDKERGNGVTGHRKHKKREDNHKLKKVNHLQYKDDIEIVGIKKKLVASGKEI